MIRLLLWLLLLNCMIALETLLRDNWELVRQAPWVFIAFFVLAWILAYGFHRSAFGEQLKGKDEQLKAKEERIKLKEEQIKDLKAKVESYQKEKEERANALIRAQEMRQQSKRTFLKTDSE